MSDLISRKAAICAIEHRLAEPAYQHTGEDWYVGMNYAESVLYDLPSAQLERIRGRWIKKPHVHGVAYCSLCDYELHTNDTNFCPNCGAYMKGEQDG